MILDIIETYLFTKSTKKIIFDNIIFYVLLEIVVLKKIIMPNLEKNDIINPSLNSVNVTYDTVKSNKIKVKHVLARDEELWYEYLWYPTRLYSEGV